MQVPRPSEADKERFRSIVPSDPGIDVKPMFGNLGAFVNGNMFMGLFGPDIGIKLSGEDADALRAIDGAGPYGPVERPMGGWITLPSAMVGTPDAARWIARSLTQVSAMPPKVARK